MARRNQLKGLGQPADVFVVFGITGDLAKVMTFRSLYRLERRGLLDCPIVGVAVDDWSAERLRDHARGCIEGTGESIDPKVFDRFAARLSYVQGDFGDAGTYKLVGEAMGVERPDLFKQWKMMQDVDRVLAELGDRPEAVGLDVESVREVLVAHVLGEQPLPLGRGFQE